MDLYPPLIVDPLIPFSLEEFEKIPDGEIFARGILPDSPDGINMHSTGKSLKWVAKKGSENDWVIYCYRAFHPVPLRMVGTTTVDSKNETSWEFVITRGNKVNDDSDILRCVNVSDEVLKLYRR